MKISKHTSAEGDIFYYNENNELHNENDEPAAILNIFGKKTKYWYHHNNIHRENGPAIEHHSGSRSWYLNGKWLQNIKSQEEFERYLRLIAFQ